MPHLQGSSNVLLGRLLPERLLLALRFLPNSESIENKIAHNGGCSVAVAVASVNADVTVLLDSFRCAGLVLLDLALVQPTHGLG